MPDFLLYKAIPPEIPATKTLYVDGNRTDTYVETGSIAKPFKLIQTAINQVITNADNATYAYDIRVASYTYPENLTFNSTSLVNLSITGEDSVTGAQCIIGTLSSTSNNANLSTLTINNITINGDVTLTGDTNSSNFGLNQISFNNCWIRTNTNGFACTNLRSVILTNCNVVPVTGNGPTFTNCNAELFTCIGVSSNATPFALVYNGAGNKPSGLTQTIVIVENTTMFANVTVGASTTFVARNGVRIGSSGGSLDISGLAQLFNSFVRNNITVNSGGSLQLFASEYLGTLTNSGTVTDTGKRVVVTTPTLLGGTATTSPLTYKTTTANGTTGADHIFQVGNNGATEAMRILNSGNIGMGIASSAVTSARLHVHGTSSTGPVLFVSNGLSDVSVFGTNIAGGIEAGVQIASFKGYSLVDTSNRIITFGKGSGNIIRIREGSSTGNVPIAFSGFDNRVMIGTDTDDGIHTFQVAGNGYFSGKLGAGFSNPTAFLHLKAGTTAATTAPLKFTSGTSMTTAEAGAIEFTTDDFFATITTGAARKAFVLDDGARLTSGKIPIATTNGRLVDGPTPLAGTKVYYVSDSSGGAVDRKLTFVDGILTSET